jgi:hypothetical protein
MWILMLEAGAAMLVLVLIVWWTMFHGRAPDRREQEATRNENDTPRN